MSTPPPADPVDAHGVPPPPGEASPAAVLGPPFFFLAAGVSEAVFSLRELPQPWPFWPAWEALGRALMHVLVAVGLLRRSGLCRHAALVYGIATIVVYAFALLLAWMQAPVRFPDSVVIQSVFLVPSCVLLLRYLRSPQAAAVYTRPLFRE